MEVPLLERSEKEAPRDWEEVQRRGAGWAGTHVGHMFHPEEDRLCSPLWLRPSAGPAATCLGQKAIQWQTLAAVSTSSRGPGLDTVGVGKPGGSWAFPVLRKGTDLTFLASISSGSARPSAPLPRPGAQMVRAPSSYAKVTGSSPRHHTHKKQPSAHIGGTTRRCVRHGSHQ